jgi:hypothetical protein
MRADTLWMLVAILALGVSGCNRAESPEKVQHDVGKATDSAAEKDARATDRLAQTDASASRDVATAEARADKKTSDAADDAIITAAEGDHKVALAHCESLSGQAQTDCRTQADEQLDAVKARVKQAKKDTE